MYAKAMATTDLPESTVDYIRALLTSWTDDSTDRVVAKLVGLSAQAIGNITRRGAPVTPRLERTIATLLSLDVTPFEALAASEMARPMHKRKLPPMPADRMSPTEPHVVRDAEVIPPDDAHGIDIEPLMRAISAEHADAGASWTDAESERAKKIVRTNRRGIDPGADIATVARGLLRAVRACGVTASDAEILLRAAFGKPSARHDTKGAK